MVELQQQVALAHLLADVNQQVVDPQAADFDAELHFFPRRHRPGHQHAARDVPRLHAHHADREGRNRLGGLFILLAVAMVATQSASPREKLRVVRRMRRSVDGRRAV